MWDQFKQLSEGSVFRILFAIGLLFAILDSALPHLYGETASVWQLVFDIGMIVAFLLLVLSLWPSAEEVLDRLWETYSPYAVGILAAFFLSWGAYLVLTPSADQSNRYLILGVGFVLAVGFVKGLRERRESAQPP